MRGQLLKPVFSLLFLGSLLTTFFWYKLDNNNVDHIRHPPQKKSPPNSPHICADCQEIIKKVKELYSKAWNKHEDNNKKFRSQLSSKCHGFDKAVITQANTPVGAKLIYDGEKRRTLQVTPEIFATFAKGALMVDGSICFPDLNRAMLIPTTCPQPPATILVKSVWNGKEVLAHVAQKWGLLFHPDENKTVLTHQQGHPFSNKTLHTCSVVGNGGILGNSSCGKMIDSAHYVIRCNLPPLSKGYEKDVGIKTDLVTANPSILFEKYNALMGRRRPFVESLRSYRDSMLLIPAFSFGHNTPVSLRAFYTIEDFESPTQPVFFNPEYLQSLAVFWRSQGLRTVRLSTGIIMASLALELCSDVHLYGFWPFSFHPQGHHNLTNHYYDNRQTKMKFHAMPAEFEFLLRLHSRGVLRLHLGYCEQGDK